MSKENGKKVYEKISMEVVKKISNETWREQNNVCANKVKSEYAIKHAQMEQESRKESMQEK